MKHDTLIINLFGGPSSGKSTTAAGLFYQMKVKGYSCELCTEWIKECVYEERKVPFQNQIYTFAKQHKRLDDLYGKVDYIINDSPILLSAVYGDEKYSKKELTDLIVAEFKRYRNKNYLLIRPNSFEKEGRVHSESESLKVDIKIQNLLDENKIPYSTIETNKEIVQKILKELEGRLFKNKDPKQQLYYLIQLIESHKSFYLFLQTYVPEVSEVCDKILTLDDNEIYQQNYQKITELLKKIEIEPISTCDKVELYDEVMKQVLLIQCDKVSQVLQNNVTYDEDSGKVYTFYNKGEENYFISSIKEVSESKIKLRCNQIAMSMVTLWEDYYYEPLGK